MGFIKFSQKTILIFQMDPFFRLPEKIMTVFSNWLGGSFSEKRVFRQICLYTFKYQYLVLNPRI